MSSSIPSGNEKAHSLLDDDFNGISVSMISNLNEVELDLMDFSCFYAMFLIVNFFWKGGIMFNLNYKGQKIKSNDVKDTQDLY